MRRVTRAQGIVSACVWDYDAGMQMLRFFWDEAVALDPAIEPRDERHMKLSRQGQLGELWRKAGLINVKEEPLVSTKRTHRSTTIGSRLQKVQAWGRLRCVAFGRSSPPARSSYAQALA